MAEVLLALHRSLKDVLMRGTFFRKACASVPTLGSVGSQTEKRCTRLSWAIIIVALLFGFFTRFVALSHYISFDGDQVSNAYVRAKMLTGLLPTVGPAISFGAYHLLPLYFYLVFPFALLGPAPWLQAIPNAVCSFLTIPLIGLGMYRLLEGLPQAKRFFWGAIGALWWSFMFADIVMGTKEWIPSPVPFFALLFALIAAGQIRTHSSDLPAFIAWAFLGVVFAIAWGLHASTLYVMPVFFLIIAIAYIVRAKTIRAVLPVSLAVLAAVVCLTPYWYGEMHRDWQNTRAIIAVMRNHSATSMPDRGKNVLRAYAWLSGQVYFVGSDKIVRMGGIAFLAMIILVPLWKFRGDRTLFLTLACSWILFLGAAANYPATMIHYKLLILTAPIFLAISSLAFLNYASVFERSVGAALSLGIIASCVANLRMDAMQEERTFGSARLAAVSDIADAFMSIPPGSSVCHGKGSWYYIDDDMTHRQFHFIEACVPGSYEIIPAFTGANDFVYNFQNYDLAYVERTDLVPAPPLPGGSRVIEKNAVLTVLVH